MFFYIPIKICSLYKVKYDQAQKKFKFNVNIFSVVKMYEITFISIMLINYVYALILYI